MNTEYSLAMSEVLCIINQSDYDYKVKIPQSFMNFIKENADSTYNPQFNINVPIKDLKLRKETKGILALIYRSYICNEEEKKEYDSILKQNEDKFQQQLKDKYDVYKMFENNQKKILKEEPEVDNSTIEMIKYKKESIFKRIFNIIRNFFYRG